MYRGVFYHKTIEVRQERQEEERYMLMSNDIGIDLGTASILVYIKGKGVVLKEPSVVAIDRDSRRIITFGEEARLMIGRTPGNKIGRAHV